jgi:ureidoglycolate lyase
MTRQLAIGPTISAEAFAPYGAFIEKPQLAGERAFYSRWLGGPSPLAPVFHVNRVPVTRLPATLSSLERHPHAAQAFVPLDISRYVVTVAPNLPDGGPDLASLLSFELPATMGVIYAPGVWHAGASVLDREGSFAVLMWRGASDDDVFTSIEPVELVEERIAA